jgi:hypothetical protein
MCTATTTTSSSSSAINRRWQLATGSWLLLLPAKAAGSRSLSLQGLQI